MKKFLNVLATVTIVLNPGSIALGVDYTPRSDTATIIQDYQYSNGCEHTVVIKGQEYALDSSSYTALENAFLKRANNVGMLRQQISYDFTGIRGTVNCTWGTRSLPQIRIYSYSPKYIFATFAKLLPDQYGSDLYGCEHTAQIGDTKYALNTDSYTTVSNMFYNTYNPNATMYIGMKYRLTGNDRSVTCRDGNKVLEEIDIGSIY